MAENHTLQILCELCHNVIFVDRDQLSNFKFDSLFTLFFKHIGLFYHRRILKMCFLIILECNVPYLCLSKSFCPDIQKSAADISRHIEKPDGWGVGDMNMTF